MQLHMYMPLYRCHNSYGGMCCFFQNTFRSLSQQYWISHGSNRHIQTTRFAPLSISLACSQLGSYAGNPLCTLVTETSAQAQTQLHHDGDSEQVALRQCQLPEIGDQEVTSALLPWQH